jgi:fluoride exporter
VPQQSSGTAQRTQYGIRHAKRAQLADRAAVIGVVAVGGVLGAIARYEASLAWPTPARGLPMTTLLINVVGSALIGVVMVLCNEVWIRQRLLRPFLSTGVLGGFTTFSGYSVDARRLVDRGRPALAVLYLAATLLAALVAVWLTTTVTRRLVTRRLR